MLGIAVLATATAFLTLCSCSAWLYFTYHALRLTGRKQLLTDLKKKFEWCPFQVEEIVHMSGHISTALFIISRVMVGQCPPDTTLFLQQTCNQLASSGGIPSELVYTIYWIPPLTQLLFRNIGIRTLIFSNITGFFSVAFCIIYGNLWNDYFALLMWILYSNASFEIERLQRVGYAQTIKILDQKELEMEQLQQERTMQEAMSAQTLKLHRIEDEKRLKEAEAVQLRSLLGNVAHDLKTPLFTIEADVETLKTIVDAIPEDVITMVVERLREESHDDDDANDNDEDDLEPRIIFDSLWATIRFMVAGG